MPPGSCGSSFCVVSHAGGAVKDVHKQRGLFDKNGSQVTAHTFPEVDLCQKARLPAQVLMPRFYNVCYAFHH